MKSRVMKITDLVKGHSGNNSDKKKLQAAHAYTQPPTLLQHK